MDEREVELLESGVRRSLATLDAVPVAPLEEIHARRHANGWTRRLGALATATLVLVLALVAGAQLSVWRNDRAAASPPTATVPAALGRVALDERYGLLVRSPGKSGGAALIDELGHQLIAPIEGLVQAKTSPNGRYIALWLQTGSGFELRLIDGVARTLGAPIFTTTERFARSSQGLVWASDSSAVLVATTADDLAKATTIRANLRAVDLAGKARLVQTITTFALEPLGWDRATYWIIARSTTQQSGGSDVLLRIADDGTARADIAATDSPLVANDAGTVVASSVRCPADPRCRRFAIHDAVTYATVAQIDLPPIAGSGGNWAVHFRPRSSDVLVSFSRSYTPTEGNFGLELYPDAGRGARRDLGSTTVKAIAQADPKAPGAVPNPNAFIRADGSAVLYVRSTTMADVYGETAGSLVDLTTGASAGVTITAPIATVVLDPALELKPVAIPPSAPVTAAVTREQAIALVRSIGEVLRVDRIEAKLMPWSEFAPVGMGIDRTGAKGGHGEFPPQSVWAVAVAGDTFPVTTGAPLGTPQQHYVWSLWGINAMRADVSSLKVGDSGTWPPGFDALADHPVAPLAAPTASPEPIRFDHLAAGAHPLRQEIRDLAAGDADATHLWAVVRTGQRGANGQEESALVRSDDGGASWETVTSAAPAPLHVAALGSTVLVSDYGYDTANAGTSTSGGLYVSRDGGGVWKRVTTESVARLFVARYQGRALFLAEHPWATKGAASGPSRIFASTDGETWREIGEVPGPANFAVLDVPLVTFSKNIVADGFYRVEGADLASLHLVAIPGSLQAGDGVLTTTPSGELWSLYPGGSAGPRRSLDGGKTWRYELAGIGGRLAGLFVHHGTLYALGDGAFQWDGAQWRTVSILTAKVTGVFQVSDWAFVQQGADAPWRSPR